MDYLSRDVIQAIALRLILAAVGITRVLRSRMEVATASTGLNQIADAAFLQAAGAGSREALGPTPIILVQLARLTSAAELPAVFLNSIADVISSSSLQHIALRVGFPAQQAAEVSTMFLWNPLTIAACVSGSGDPLKNVGIFAAAAAAASGHPLASGAALAWAVHLSSPHTVLLVIPLVILALRGATKPGKMNFIASLLAGVLGGSTLLAVAGGFLASGSLARALQSLPDGILHAINELLGVGYRLPGDGVVESSFSSAGSSSQAEPWSNLNPNIGLQWYLFAEVFPIFRPFFAYVFAALRVALCIAIPLRFFRDPVLGLTSQAMVLCMLGRHPTYADIMQWLGLLPIVLRQGGAKVPHAARPWLALSFFTCLALNTAAYELWLTLGTGNANFFYGMNLLWAGWQAIALIQLLKAAAAAGASTFS